MWVRKVEANVYNTYVWKLVKKLQECIFSFSWNCSHEIRKIFSVGSWRQSFSKLEGWNFQIMFIYEFRTGLRIKIILYSQWEKRDTQLQPLRLLRISIEVSELHFVFLTRFLHGRRFLITKILFLYPEPIHQSSEGIMPGGIGTTSLQRWIIQLWDPRSLEHTQGVNLTVCFPTDLLFYLLVSSFTTY